MSNLIAAGLGYSGPTTGPYGGRNAHTLPNGNALVVWNNPQSPFEFRLYESADRVNWTLRSTLQIPSGYQFIQGVSTALYPNGDLGIAVAAVKGGSAIDVIFAKYTYSGSTLSAWDTIFSAGSGFNFFACRPILDLDVSDGSIPYVAVSFREVSTNNAFVRMLAKVGTSWSTIFTQTLAVGGNGSTAGTLSVVALGVNGNVRRLIYATSWNTASGNSPDSGVTLTTFSFNESTAALDGNITARATYGANWETQGFAPTRKSYLFRVPGPGTGDQWVLAVHQGDSGNAQTKNGLFYVKGVVNGSDGAFGVIVQPVVAQHSPGNYVNSLNGSAGVGADGSVMFFLPMKDSDGDNSVWNVIFKCDPGSGVTVFGGRLWNNYYVESPNIVVTAGGYRNAELNYFDTSLSSPDDGTKHQHLLTPKTLTSFTPSDGQTGVSATPNLTGVITGERDYSQDYYKVQYQFSLDPAFPSSGRTSYTQADDRLIDMHGAYVNPKTYSDTLPNQYALPAGIWYVRARLVDVVNRVGAWFSDGRKFNVGHPPSANVVSPVNNRYVDYGNGDVTFTWEFVDSSKTDSQTAYQFRLKRDSDGAVIVDSGKVSSSSKSVTYNIPSAYKNVNLYWDVRLWDTDNAAGPYSSGPSYFQAVDPASVTVTTPTQGQVLANGIPTIVGKVATTGVRTVKEWVFVVTSAGKDVWTSKRYFGNLSNNQSMSATVPDGLLMNNSQYTIQIRIVDDAQISNASQPISVSTAWTPPTAPSGVTASTADFDVDGLGSNMISWSDTGREAEFSGWVVYRRVDVMNPFTGGTDIVGTLQEVGRVYSINTAGYSIKDYLCPAGNKVTYIVRQLVDRNGFRLQSENTTGAVVYPMSSSYFLIDTLNSSSPTVIKLDIVSSDSFTDEQEEAEYNVIGRGRHVDKGQYLGAKGSLEVKIRHGRSGSPRAHRLKLLDLQKRNGVLYLRNPFGDVWKVNVSQMTVGRLAGVGTTEFVDVTLPYATVG